MPEPSLLLLEGFGVAFRDRTVLSGVDLTAPAIGATVLAGPGGGGKSTLLRTLAGFNAAQPALRTWGRAEFAGAPLGAGELPAMLMQNARLLLDDVLENVVAGLPERRSLTRLQQIDLVARLLDRAGLGELADRLDDPVIDLPAGLQRRLAIVRTTAPNPRMVCLDEPTADLPEADAEAVLALIAAEAGRRAVLVTTHNQKHARRLGGTTALLVGGRIVENRPTAEFFDDPRTAPARQFVRTGSCYPPEPESPDEEAAAPESGPVGDTAAGRSGPPTVVAIPSAGPKSTVPPPAPAAESAPPLPEPRDHSAERRRQIAAAGAGAFGPRGFRWLKPGRLGGTPRPGLLDDTPDADLAALAQIGVTVLVTLEEEPFDPEALARHGIEPAFSPVRDMEAPAVEAAAALCGRIAAWNAAGRAVAVHCRAGLGRTGTQMAAQLIWEGAGPLEALEAVRRIDPRWVQSEAQVKFLRRFAEARPPERGRAKEKG